jgi:hypothetical protein
MGSKSWKELERQLNRCKRIYRKRPSKTQPEPEQAFYGYDSANESLRVIMSNWYHGQFSNIKTRNCNEDQLWGDLTVEQRMNLKKILNGEI